MPLKSNCLNNNDFPNSLLKLNDLCHEELQTERFQGKTDYGDEFPTAGRLKHSSQN